MKEMQSQREQEELDRQILQEEEQTKRQNE
jgi:hypothetical protein